MVSIVNTYAWITEVKMLNSIIGTGIQNTPGYAARMFGALSEQDINIQLISTSEIRITCIIDESRVMDAVRALHQAFELDIKQ